MNRFAECVLGLGHQFHMGNLQDLDQKRQARKVRRPDPTSTVACPQCGRIFASNFGLRSHIYGVTDVFVDCDGLP